MELLQPGPQQVPVGVAGEAGGRRIGRRTQHVQAVQALRDEHLGGHAPRRRERGDGLRGAEQPVRCRPVCRPTGPRRPSSSPRPRAGGAGSGRSRPRRPRLRRTRPARAGRSIRPGRWSAGCRRSRGPPSMAPDASAGSAVSRARTPRRRSSPSTPRHQSAAAVEGVRREPCPQDTVWRHSSTAAQRRCSVRARQIDFPTVQPELSGHPQAVPLSRHSREIGLESSRQSIQNRRRGTPPGPSGLTGHSGSSRPPQRAITAREPALSSRQVTRTRPIPRSRATSRLRRRIAVA